MYPSRKEILTVGVRIHYGMELGELDQNVIDAIADGHCHLSKQLEAEVVFNTRPNRHAAAETQEI